MKRLYILFILVTFALSYKVSYGQSAGFMLISPDARTIALGGESPGIVSGIYGFNNNTASVLFTGNKGAAGASYSSWLPSTLENSMIGGSGYFRTGERSAISFGYSNVSYADIELSDQYGNRDGFFTPSEYFAGVGFSYLLGDNLSAAVNVKYVSSDLGGESAANAFAGDATLFYMKENLSLGLVVANIGSSLDYGNGAYSLPANAKFGAGLEQSLSEKGILLLTASAGMIFEGSSFMAGAGAEYTYDNLFSLRVGAHYGDKEKSLPSYLSAGAGLNIQGLELNFAYVVGQSDSPVNNSFNIGLGYNF
jgi:hypothetical protein